MRSVVILLLGLAVAPPLQAQDRATIVQLVAYRDTLARLTDSSRVGALVRTLTQASRQSKDPIAALRAGLGLLRLAQLTDGHRFADARARFARAQALRPLWAFPVYGIGLAELGRGAWLAGNPAELGNRVGYGSYHAAVDAFIAALRRDPAFASPGLALADLVQRLRDTTIADSALVALQSLAAADSAAPAILLWTGRLERDAGNFAAAVRDFDRFRALSSDRALGNLEFARSLLAAGEAGGDALYFELAASPDSTETGGLRADLEPIADSAALAEFDQRIGEDRAAWLRQFWLLRDRLELRAPGERLREHYRRLYQARRRYALQVNRRFYTDVDLFRKLDTELDDRGVVYIRQGEPDERITTAMFALNGNETWIYRRPEGDLILHFGAGGYQNQGGASDDYRLVSSVLDLWRPGAPADMLLHSRASASDLYERMIAWGPHGQARALADERKLVEQSAVTGVTTDGYQLRYDHPLDATVQLLVTGAGIQSELHVVFAVPHDSAGMMPVRLRLGLFDAGMSPAAAFDTTVSISEVSGRFPSDLGHIIVPVAPGTWKYRLAIERGTAGTLFSTDSIRVQRAESFQLSDLAMAALDNGIVWQPEPGDSVLLSPFQAFQRDQSIEVYYELYGLPSGREFHTTIAVFERRGNRSGSPRLELGFSETSGGETNRLHRTVRLDGLRKGRYWLEVRVRDEGGVERRTRREFQVTN